MGSGIWVEGLRGRGFFTLLRESLAMERTEVGDLAGSFDRPPRAEAVLDRHGNVAWIDDDLDRRERDFMQSFEDLRPSPPWTDAVFG